jgi:hypothetical protein
MTGLLAQTNAYIRDAERQSKDLKARQDQVRRPVQLIDQLLQELEELNLKGFKRVPMAYEPRLEEILRLVGPVRSLADDLANIKVKVGISKLMDALFAVEEALFTERHGPAVTPTSRATTTPSIAPHKTFSVSSGRGAVP